MLKDIIYTKGTEKNTNTCNYKYLEHQNKIIIWKKVF